jgi:biopolymer transport protein ExbB
MEKGAGLLPLFELFRMGGFFMWPLLFFSIAAVALVIERTACLLRRGLRLDDMEETILRYERKGEREKAKAYLERNLRYRAGARILLTLVEGLPDGKRGADFSARRLEKAVEAEARDCVNSLETGFNLLAALGSLAPLTGFLGTVSGMIAAFRSIAGAEEVNAQIVASGIYEALITTAFGLVIALVAMTAHALFTHITDRFAAEIEKTCSGLLLALVPEQADTAGKM